MNTIDLIIGIVLLVALMVFAGYALLAIRHAAKFRYLSTRTLYLTLFFVATSAILIILSIVSYVMLIIN